MGFGPFDSAAGFFKASGNSAAISVTGTPTGTFSTEIAVAYFNLANGGNNITAAPPGWFLLYSQSGSNQLYYKVVSNTSPLTFAANLNVSDQWSITLAFFGFDGFQPFTLTQVQTSVSVLTVNAVNTLAVGNVVIFSNVANATWLNGQVGVVASASPTQFTINNVFGHANYGPTADTGVVSLQVLQATSFVSGGGPSAVIFGSNVKKGSTFAYLNAYGSGSGITAVNDNFSNTYQVSNIVNGIANQAIAYSALNVMDQGPIALTSASALYPSGFGPNFQDFFGNWAGIQTHGDCTQNLTTSGFTNGGNNQSNCWQSNTPTKATTRSTTGVAETNPGQATFSYTVYPTSSGQSSSGVFALELPGGPIPTIVVSPATLSFTQFYQGPAPAPQNIFVTNGGSPPDTVPFTFTDSSDQPWLFVAPLSGSLPTGSPPVFSEALQVSVVPDSLVVGSYTGHITTLASAAGSPAVVTVKLTITPAQTVTTITSTPNPSVQNQTVNFTVTVTAPTIPLGSPPLITVPPGTVTIFANGNPISFALTPNANGIVTYQFNRFLVAENYNIQAVFTSSSPNFTSSSATLVQQVNTPGPKLYTNAPYTNRLAMVCDPFIGPFVHPTLGSFDPRRDMSFYVDGKPLTIASFNFDVTNNRYLMYTAAPFNLQGLIQGIHHMPQPPFQTVQAALSPGFFTFDLQQLKNAFFNGNTVIVGPATPSTVNEIAFLGISRQAGLLSPGWVQVGLQGFPEDGIFVKFIPAPTIIQENCSLANQEWATNLVFFQTNSMGPLVQNITSVQVTNNVVTCQCLNQFINGTWILFSGMTNPGPDTFLNGQTLQITGVTPTSFTVNFTHPNTGPNSENATATNLPYFQVAAQFFPPLNGDTFMTFPNSVTPGSVLIVVAISGDTNAFTSFNSVTDAQGDVFTLLNDGPAPFPNACAPVSIAYCQSAKGGSTTLDIATTRNAGLGPVPLFIYEFPGAH